MDKRALRNALNQLLTVLERSMPMYLSYAAPWTRNGDDKAVTALRRIVEEQQALANRVAELVLELGPTNVGDYPVEYYDMHDLALDYLLGKLVEYQKRDIGKVERIVDQIQTHRPAAALAEETLGTLRAQQETLEELADELGASKVTWMMP
ncbi:MAG: hypothetical protein WD845_16955 [Pirellulales bacterium]